MLYLQEFSFSSLNWLYIMAGVTLLFWLTPAKWRWLTLSSATAFLLYRYDTYSFLLLATATLLCYLANNNDHPLPGKKAAWLIAILVGMLLTFKVLHYNIHYSNGFVIPLGLAYYTLRCIHLIIERYKGKQAPLSPVQLISYLFFLPTLWIGPIHRSEAFLQDQRRHRWDSGLFSQGLERIVWGYFKVIFVAGYLFASLFAAWAEQYATANPQLHLYLTMVQGGFVLYYLFAGYSDIAIGFGNLLGFKVMENFKHPYWQTNISLFWRSWHISLTSWCREYIYTGVIANTRSSALASLCTLVAIGLWHEASLLYLLWGIYHGLGIVIWQKFSQFCQQRNLLQYNNVFAKAIKITLTVHFVWLGFLLVSQPDWLGAFTTAKLLFLGA